MDNAPLAAKDLSIGYQSKGPDAETVASNLNLHLDRGELVCLLGPNGCGKSTLIRALCGMAKPLSGTVEINGNTYDQLSPRQRAQQVSVVLTDTATIGLMSVYSLVALGRHPHTNWTGNLSQHDRQKIEWAIDAVNCRELAHRQIGELSDGERQKAMIARALAQETPIMLLDEPTAFLDLARRVELMRILRDLAHNEGLSILLSTHDLDLALRCADRLWLYDSDKAITQGPPEDLALNGSIAQSFASDKLDWDTELGSFRLHREPCLHVCLKGSGPERTWTQRALARLGYGVAQEEQKASLEIEIIKGAWHVRSGEAFQSLHEFINWLRSNSDHKESR